MKEVEEVQVKPKKMRRWRKKSKETPVSSCSLSSGHKKWKEVIFYPDCTSIEFPFKRKGRAKLMMMCKRRRKVEAEGLELNLSLPIFVSRYCFTFLEENALTCSL